MNKIIHPIVMFWCCFTVEICSHWNYHCHIQAAALILYPFHTLPSYHLRPPPPSISTSNGDITRIFHALHILCCTALCILYTLYIVISGQWLPTHLVGTYIEYDICISMGDTAVYLTVRILYLYNLCKQLYNNCEYQKKVLFIL
jgi:hypothetical protein